MSKLLHKLIAAENDRMGLHHRAPGAYTTFTRGFGLQNDMQLAMIANEGGGVIGCGPATVRNFRKVLAENQKVNGKRIRCYALPPSDFDRFTVVYMDDPPRNVNGKLLRECVGFSGHGEAMLGDHLGKLVMFADLPESLQRTVERDCAND